jgi:hypothetical protein
MAWFLKIRVLVSTTWFTPALKGGTALGFCFSTLIKRRWGRYSDLEMVVGWEAAGFIVMPTTKGMYTTD